ncbi:hypothetical protein L21SP2_2418 [Salinispira pacifica]|uniref:tRNA dimethylallyltransferase n=1 Tax=Salinispira pacifica TaxID=1307761 RepID=V5WKQ1_9SPIO|nr:hypothetical protein L21SP2_2418 [Salinispira pacifica]
MGKTAALEMLGSRIPGIEVISADSMQVYRGMDIGTAKADEGEQKAVPHHLLDIRNPDEGFNLADFISLAEEKILRISARGAVPVISGGTAFYFKHLWFGLPQSPPGDPAVRRELEKELKSRSAEQLHRELSEIDPESADRIHPNDSYRIIRALEVYRSSGRPLSDYHVPDSPRNDMDLLVYGLDRPRDELYERINLRVENMFKSGLESELCRLMRSGYTKHDPGMKAIGYREFFRDEYRDELLSRGRLGEEHRSRVLEEIQTASRRYAKRQLTFFRALPDVKWIHPDNAAEIIHEITGKFNVQEL